MSNYNTLYLQNRVAELGYELAELRVKIKEIIEKHHLHEFNIDVATDLEELLADG
jgi:hypothetical protein